MYMIETGYPLISYRQRLTDAQVALARRGERAVAVILAQTAVEIFLDGVLSLLLWEEGTEANKAAGTAFREGLAKRVRTHLPSRLGGNWTQRGKDPIGHLYSCLFPLRGRVVHGGYEPSFAEAEHAIETLHMVEEFVLQRLAIRRLRYPSTALQVLGWIGLQDRGHWSGQIRKWADEHDAGEEMAKYMAWRKEFEAARTPEARI